MGREVRRVPRNWQHPRDEEGGFIPMSEYFPYNAEEIEEGLRDGWLEDDPPNYGCPVMPEWSEDERTHFQMYETVTEGTPISPVMETLEDLARWLADNKANASAGQTATYEQWLTMIKAGWAPSFMLVPGKGLISGVEAMGDEQDDKREEK